MFLVVLMYALFASVFTISKTGLEYTQPLFFVGSRMLLAGIAMLGYLYFYDRKLITIKKEHILRLCLLAFFSIYLTNALEFWGLKYLTSFKTCFIYSLSPFISALFSYWTLNDKMSSKKWLGLIVGFFGFLPILLNETSTEEQTGHLFFLSGAELAVMGAACSGVYGWILLKQMVQDNGYSPWLANGLSMTLGGVLALIHSALVESWDPIPVTEVQPFLECMLTLILISNFICYNMYGYLLRSYSATFVSFAGFVTPLFTALFGWYYLGEIVTWPFYISALIVFAGLYTFYQEELKQDYYKPVSDVAT